MRTDESVSSYGYIEGRMRPVRRIVPFMFAKELDGMHVGDKGVCESKSRSSIAQLVRACGC